MTINLAETKKEEKKFYETKEWIKEELIKTQEKYDDYEKKVASLKRSSGGTYSTDLILAENSFSIIKKNIHKLTESSNNPYFARIDFKEKIRELESFYIGKFGIIDEVNMEEIVIDWRAPLANLYYSGTFGEASYKAPLGEIKGELLLKRKFQVKDGEIINIFDEGVNELIVPNSEDGEELVDEFLKVNLEGNMNKKLKDVVTTIQKEQNEIIRAYKNKPIIIQGSAGSGKTTVALHRLAYLVYTYGDEMNNKNILVVAPNEVFLDYISDILPNLGVSNVKQITFEGLCNEIVEVRYKIISKDDKLIEIIENDNEEEIKYITASSKIKGTLSYKTMMDRLIKYMERENSVVSDIVTGEYVIYTAKEIKRLYLKDLVNLPLNKRRNEIEKYLKGKLNNRLEDVKKEIEDSYYFKVKEIKKNINLQEVDKRAEIIKIYDERDALLKKLKKNANIAIKEYFKEWKLIDPVDIYTMFFKEENIFKEVTSQAIPNKLEVYMRKEFYENYSRGYLDSDDLTAIAYLKIKLDGVNKEDYIHTVIDEAQDYSYFQFSLLKEVTKNDSMTIVGDLGQGIYDYKGIHSWIELMNKVFEDEATYINLSQSYRSTVEIIDFANIVLKKQNLNIKPAKPILRHGPKPKLIKCDENIGKVIDSLVYEIYEAGKKTVAIICKDKNQCVTVFELLSNISKNKWTLISDSSGELNDDLIIIPSYMTKGLEFDATIIFGCDEDNYSDNLFDKKLLYVVLTRALHLEYVLYKEDVTSILK